LTYFVGLYQVSILYQFLGIINQKTKKYKKHSIYSKNFNLCFILTKSDKRSFKKFTKFNIIA